MASTYLTRTPSSNGSETKGTFSAWVKKTGLGNYYKMYTSYQASNEFLDIQFNNSDQLAVTLLIGGSTFLDLRTTRLFRDVGSWYHIVMVIDSTDSTQADRCKIYVNGTRITDFATNTNNVSSSGTNMRINSTSQNVYIGSWHNADYFDGCMSHVHWVDGTAYQASTFGSTDSTTGEWKINTSPTVTYGTNGFFILKDSNSVTDQSGNSNNLTVGAGTLTNTEDNPSNNFATLNPLINPDVGNRSTYTNGNTKGNTTSAGHISGISTMAVSEGKYYCESKSGSSGSGHVFGVIQANKNIKGTDPQDFSGLYGVSANGTRYVAGTQTGSWGGSYTYNNVMGLALDMDASPPKLHIHYNGSYSNGSGAYNQTFDNSVPITLGADEMYHFFFGDNTSSGTYDHQVNFGNGYFATTAISSEGTNASGHGKFEYDVPTGYTALCTKGLNE